MMYSFEDKDVLIVGGSSDIAAALAADLLQAIGEAVRPITLDLSDEESIQEAADQIGAAGGLDHLVSVAVERANGPVASAERRSLLTAFNAKVVGPILLAKHFAPLIAEGARCCSSPAWPRGDHRREVSRWRSPTAA